MARHAASPTRFWWLLALSGALVTVLYFLVQDPVFATAAVVVGAMAIYGLLVALSQYGELEDSSDSRWSRAMRIWRSQRRRKRLRRLRSRDPGTPTLPGSGVPPEPGDPPSSDR